MTTTTTFDLERAFARHRVELTVYCARMLGSTADAEDAVQDTLVRGWRALDRFEGRSSLKSWLYRIATNVCHDALRRRQRRPRPVDVSDDGIAGVAYLDARAVPADVPDPADVVVERDAVRRAFVAALGHIPPRQHAIVILCDVLRWEATEVAELLDTTPAAVNSMHQRARYTLATRARPRRGRVDEAVVDRYVDAFARYDLPELVSLLRDAA
jgi:RNA polymerase sigma-70 factor, ECF subfamily